VRFNDRRHEAAETRYFNEVKVPIVESAATVLTRNGLVPTGKYAGMVEQAGLFAQRHNCASGRRTDAHRLHQPTAGP
jgi:hypothetical protein